MSTARRRVDARLRIGLTGTSVVDAGDVSENALRGRRGFGGWSADVSALSANAVSWLVLTVRRRRTGVDASFAAGHDFVRRGKLALSEFED